MPPTLKQHAYQVIRDKLLQGSLKAGTRLSDDVLAQEMGISRSPVREAITQLASEGLVEHRPRTGAFVKQPDRRELEELYEIREALEQYAVRQAALRIGAADLARLRELCDEMRGFVRECRKAPMAVAPPDLVQRFLANDLAFHTVLVGAAGNQRLTKLLTDFKILIQVFGFVPVEHDARVLATTCRAHGHIARAVAQHDARAAGLWLGRHIRAAKRIVLAGYDRAAERGSPPGGDTCCT
jgi:DNA-binding GntR family transcriptional regulator